MEESTRIMKRWRRFGAFFGLAWLFLLVIYAAQEAGGGHPPAQKLATIAAAAVFAALYAAYWISTARTGQPVGALPIVLALCAIATGTSLASYENWSGLFIFCAIAAGYGFDWRRAVPATIGVVALAGAVGLAARASPDWFVIVLPVTLLTGLGMVAISRMVVAYREVRLAREETAQLAVTEERLRFARDLHDLLGHSLSVIVLKAELAGKLMEASTEGAAKEVHDIERVAREALREVRDAVSGYREPALSQEVEGARQALQAAGIRVTLEQKAAALPPQVESVLAWAVREGATNVLRHSRARRVRLCLASADGRAELELSDDGVGPNGEAGGSGLRGLRERVQARGGRLEVGARPGGGFRLAVSVPIGAAGAGVATT